MKTTRFTLLQAVLLLSASAVQAQSTPASTGGTGAVAGNTVTSLPAATDPPTPPVDPRIAELDRQIELTKKQSALLAEQKNLQTAKYDALKAQYPVAAVTAKQGEATGVEHTAFLADWLLSANLSSLVPQPGEKDAIACSLAEPTLVVGGDTPPGPSLLLAESLHANLKALTRSANRWTSAAETLARKNANKKKKDENRESGLIGALMMGQSVATQTIDLIKYFRTDVDFKPALTTLPTYALRSEIARHCAGARLPEMAIPSNSPILSDYAALTEAADALRLALALHATDLHDEMKSAGLGLLTTIDAFRKDLVAPIAGQPTLLVQAAQVLSQKDVRRILTVRVMDEGGTSVKRTNLFFLTPRFSYVATASADYVLTDRESGAELWHATRQVRAQLNQKYSRWRGTDVEVLDPQTSRVD